MAPKARIYESTRSADRASIRQGYGSRHGKELSKVIFFFDGFMNIPHVQFCRAPLEHRYVSMYIFLRSFAYHSLRIPWVLLFLGTPLLLGSWYGLLFALVLIAGMAVRAILEECVLREELPGYDAYMAQVKYRFIPYIW